MVKEAIAKAEECRLSGGIILSGGLFATDALWAYKSTNTTSGKTFTGVLA